MDLCRVRHSVDEDPHGTICPPDEQSDPAAQEASRSIEHGYMTVLSQTHPCALLHTSTKELARRLQNWAGYQSRQGIPPLAPASIPASTQSNTHNLCTRTFIRTQSHSRLEYPHTPPVAGAATRSANVSEALITGKFEDVHRRNHTPGHVVWTCANPYYRSLPKDNGYTNTTGRRQYFTTSRVHTRECPPDRFSHGEALVPALCGSLSLRGCR